ncbi:MAG: hypothetical protein WCE90_02600 [Candidatus Zixiibacteriota bacterium]
MKSDINDISLAKPGRLRIEWADRNMPVLRLIRGSFAVYPILVILFAVTCTFAALKTNQIPF